MGLRVLPMVVLALVTACDLQRSGLAVGRRDAGLDGGPDARPDGCAASQELCNGSDDDCDGRTDEESPGDDPAHCASCGDACPDPPSGRPVCNDHVCGLECDPGRGNCNGDPADGCEAVLSSATSCGGCGLVCTDPTPLCAPSGDTFACTDSCGALMLCDGSCVDVTSDRAHCGDCFRACSGDHGTPSCRAGDCEIDCDDGFGDCNADARGDGCERPLTTLADCGDCDTPCAPDRATADCRTGDCTIAACDPGRANCNGDVDDGCETTVGTDSHCAGCGDRCLPPRSCVDGTCGSPCPPGCPDSMPTCDDSGVSSCGCSSSACDCTLTCEIDCRAHCSSGSVCTVAAEDVDTLVFDCTSGATCAIDAGDATTVDIRCAGRGTDCDVSCEGADSCLVDCRMSAACLLRCAGAGSCRYSHCPSGPSSCPGGVLACNSPCP